MQNNKRRNKYNKPILVEETFIPQEFCVICDKKVTDLHNYGFYLDWNPNGTTGYFDYGSEFINTLGNMQGSVDGVYYNVQAYKLLYSPYSSGDINTAIAYELQAGHAYTTSSSGFTIEGSTNRYRFKKLKIIDIKIKEGHVYYNKS